jgi:hypothetical protein
MLKRIERKFKEPLGKNVTGLPQTTITTRNANNVEFATR